MIACRHKTPEPETCVNCQRVQELRRVMLRRKELRATVADSFFAVDTHSPVVSSVVVPTVAPLNLNPTRKHALVTVANGTQINELFAVSRPLMEAYAKRHNLDFVVLDQPGPRGWLIGAKFAIPKTLDHYERILFVDADILLLSDAPNWLDFVDKNKIGMWDDLPDILTLGGGFMDEFLRFRELMGLSNKPPFRIENYWNTGVIVMSRQHQHYFNSPTAPIPAWHCSEQHWWVSNMIDQSAPMQELPREANWQWWADPGFQTRPVPKQAALHFSGWTTGHAARLQAMKHWATITNGNV